MEKFLLLVFVLIVGGCSGDAAVSHNNSPIEWDMSKDDEVLAFAKIQLKTFEDEGFTEVTEGESDSLVSSKKIRVWVNDRATEKYKGLSEGDVFDVGSAVIRVMLDDQSQIEKITAAIKAAPGKNPDANDWMFLVATPEGVVVVDDEGQWQFGALPSCNFCHVNKLSTDGLFGLP